MIFIALMDGDFIEIFCIFLFIYCHHSFLSVCVFFVIFCFCLFLVLVFFFFFFFQAEDGIRDPLVTGVSDVCSSDLRSKRLWTNSSRPPDSASIMSFLRRTRNFMVSGRRFSTASDRSACNWTRLSPAVRAAREIGRASCRERG